MSRRFVNQQRIFRPSNPHNAIKYNKTQRKIIKAQITNHKKQNIKNCMIYECYLRQMPRCPHFGWIKLNGFDPPQTRHLFSRHGNNTES